MVTEGAGALVGDGDGLSVGFRVGRDVGRRVGCLVLRNQFQKSNDWAEVPSADRPRRRRKRDSFIIVSSSDAEN